MSNYSLDMPELKSRFFYLSVKMHQSDDIGFYEAFEKLKTWAKEHSKCIGHYVRGGDIFLEFSEEKLASNLRTLLSSIDRLTVKRNSEQDFHESTKTLRNHLKERNQIPRLFSNVTIFDVTTIETNHIENHEYKLNKFSIKLPVNHLDQIQGIVSKISFDNPNKTNVCLFINDELYKSSIETSIDFSFSPNAPSTIHTIPLASIKFGAFSKEIEKHFPQFYKENIEEKCCNFSKVDKIHIEGLDPEEFITLDCYTIVRSVKGFEDVPFWVTYTFTV